MRRTFAVLLILGLILLAPMGQAHASPDPLEVEQHLLDDDIDDSYSQYDGFDIQDVYLREASFADRGDGVVVRVFLYGGFGPQAIASSLPLEVDITAGGSVHTLTASTSDGTTWTGSSILEQEMEDEDGQAQGYLQLFASYTDLGVNVGDTIGPFEVRTYADADLRDVAPGGRPVPGTNGEVMVPADDSTKKDSITLAGPTGYTETTITVMDNKVRVAIQNEIAAVGQHIMMNVDAPTGWTINPTTFSPAVVEPGQHPAYIFDATAAAESGDATITIRTDLGGLEVLTLSAGDVPATGSEPTPADPDPQEPDNVDTPMPLWTLVVALGAVAAAMRRR